MAGLQEWDWDQYYVRPFDFEGEVEDQFEREKILAEAEGIPDDFEDEEDDDDFDVYEDDWDEDWDEDDEEWD